MALDEALAISRAEQERGLREYVGDLCARGDDSRLQKIARGRSSRAWIDLVMCDVGADTPPPTIRRARRYRGVHHSERGHGAGRGLGILDVYQPLVPARRRAPHDGVAACVDRA
jgi:hypothetical protein